MLIIWKFPNASRAAQNGLEGRVFETPGLQSSKITSKKNVHGIGALSKEARNRLYLYIVGFLQPQQCWTPLVEMLGIRSLSCTATYARLKVRICSNFQTTRPYFLKLKSCILKVNAKQLNLGLFFTLSHKGRNHWHKKSVMKKLLFIHVKDMFCRFAKFLVFNDFFRNHSKYKPLNVLVTCPVIETSVKQGVSPLYCVSKALDQRFPNLFEPLPHQGSDYVLLHSMKLFAFHVENFFSSDRS